MKTNWRCLETIIGWSDVAVKWKEHLGEAFPSVKEGFLEPDGKSRGFPCPHECGCSHDVIEEARGVIVAVCTCDPWRCDDIYLKPDDITLWKFNVDRFARALCRALDIDRREADFGLLNTTQIGVFSATVPVILTIQYDADEFRGVVAELAVRLPEGFILLAPSGRFLDARCQELLAKARAGFFELESTVVTTPRGELIAPRQARDLFAPWAGSPKVVIEEAARAAFAIVQALDAEKPSREAPLLTVFRLYCVQARSAEDVARECGCSKATVINRLKRLEERTGARPDELRRYSPQFQAIEDAMGDPRARRVRRVG
jgi:hypothetical protein